MRRSPLLPPLLACLALLVAATAATAVPCVDYTQHLRWLDRRVYPAAVQDLAGDAGWLLAGTADGELRLLDLAAPGDPFQTWSVVVDTVVACALVTESGWVVDGTGLRAVDLATASLSPPVAVAATPGRLAATTGGVAAVLAPAPGGSALRLFAPRPDAAPAPVDSLALPSGLARLAGGGDLLVAVGTGDTSLVVLRVDDAGAATVQATASLGPLTAVALDGDRLAVAGEGRLALYDLSDPAAPRLLASAADSVTARDAALAGATLLVATGEEVVAYRPAGAVLVPAGRVPAAAGRLAAAGGWLYAGDAAGDLHLVALGDGTAVAPPVSRPPGPDPVVERVAAAGTLLAAAGTTADGPRLWTADPDAEGGVAWRGSVALPHRAADLAASARLAVTAWFDSMAGYGGIDVVVISAPDQPRVAGTLTIPGDPRRVGVAWRRAVVGVADTPGGIGDHLLQVDLSDPDAPAYLQHNLLPYPPAALVPAGDDRWWLTGDDGRQQYVELFDLADPFHPRLVEGWLLNRLLLDLVPTGGLLAAVDDLGILEVLEPTPEGYLLLRDTLWLPGAGNRIAVAGGVAYAGGRGTFLADLADPDRLRPLGTCAPGNGRAGDVATVGDAVVAALGADGVAVVPPPCAAVPVLLDGLALAHRPGGARLSWRLSRPVPAADQRLQMEWTGGTGELVVRALGDGTFAADAPPTAGQATYRLLLRDGDRWRELAALTDPGNVPPDLRLDPPAPNPANPSTTIRCALARPGRLRVTVVAVDGRRVRTLHDGPVPAGALVLRWDGRDDAGREAASGVYRVVAEGEGGRQVRPLTLLR